MISPDIFSILLVMIPALIALGAVSGVLAGLLGIGGGVVLVPGLMLAFKLFGYDNTMMMHVAVGTSLAIIVPTGLSSFYAHYKKGSIDRGIIMQIGAGILVGVVSGTFLASILSGESLKIIFACAIAVLAGLMVWTTQFSKTPQASPDMQTNIHPAKSGIAGVFIGTLSSLIGIGGATLSVPFMTLNGVPIHRAIGSATALGLVISIPASLGFMWIGQDASVDLPPFSVGYVNALAWLCIVPSAVLCAPLGATFAHKLPVKTLKTGFAGFMILIAVKLWIDLL
jgi:uncharacterized membrane protein YfcA